MPALKPRILLTALFGAAALVTTLRTASGATPLVSHGDAWRYHKGTNAPQSDWRTTADASLDATWLTGNGGFGYATDNSAETSACQTILGDMIGSAATNYTTLYLRKQFTVSSAPATNLHLFLRMDFDDGYIAWLDGNYLTNRNVTVAPAQPANTATANASHEASTGNNSPQPVEINDLGQASSLLGVGTHTLAIIGLNNGKTSTDLIQVADLYTETVTNGAPGCVSGAIATNTTWYASNSPVVVCGSVTINSNVTLIIEAGVTVQLGSGVSITVANGGQILAEGDASTPIHFTNGVGVTAWGGLIINGGVGSPETRLVYVDFSGNGSSVCIDVAGGTLSLDHATFATTTHRYLALDDASFLISGCVFPSCTTSSGFELLHGTGGIKQGGRGIVRDSFFGSTVNYNDIMDFTGGNQGQGQPILQFYNNVFAGASDDILDLDGTDAWIEGNIFLHSHKNGSPDTSSAISGGSTGNDTSQITIIGNIFFDCDQAAMGKQGNFYTLINNTIVHQTRAGGTDTDGGVVCVEDAGVSEALGMYLEGNIIYDAEKLVRNLNTAIVTLSNNILPMAWAGAGGGNTLTDPLLKHVPLVSETVFTNWSQAQVMWDWFSLQTNSPALGAGPNGRDQGALIPYGVSISGEPRGTTSETNATLTVGFRRTGNGIPTAGWPNGSGFTHYRWRLDTNLTFSPETPMATPISLTGLADGPHHVEVIGKNDAGLYQDDAALGPNAVVTLSRTWNVQASCSISSHRLAAGDFILQFLVTAGNSYSVQYRDGFDASHPWLNLTNVPPQSWSGDCSVTDTGVTSRARFYRIVAPQQP